MLFNDLMKEQIEMHKEHRSKYQAIKDGLHAELNKYDDIESLWEIFDLIDLCDYRINDLTERIKNGQTLMQSRN